VTVDFYTLTPGQQIVDMPLAISAAVADAYRHAVEDSASPDDGAFVPPTAVAALALAAAIDAVSLPAGAVHTAQELEFAAPVPPGASLRCTAEVSQNSVRGGVRFLTLQFKVSNGGVAALSGHSSILIPIVGAGA
jgi:acyl dehydratase